MNKKMSKREEKKRDSIALPKYILYLLFYNFSYIHYMIYNSVAMNSLGMRVHVDSR